MNHVARVIWNELLPHSPVFTTAVVAERAGIARSNASRDLAELARGHMVTRIRRGLWAVPNHPDFSPYAVVPNLFAEQPGGYVSLLSALNLHGMIDQIPRAVHVVTTAQRPALKSAVAAYEFYRIQADLFGGFKLYRRTGTFDIATPEKALFDTLYFSSRKGRRFSSLPELDVPADFSACEMKRWVALIDHPPLRIAVQERWWQLAEGVGLVV
ncbi:MAG: hypothetical protein HYT81_10950 [Gemmatimonadetes bacterium]|nr:hypothetical protein [Gemmatimonadota bacterium]MBI2402301.1 hypothetical protein [Gemmatimonadota bacterium]